MTPHDKLERLVHRATKFPSPTSRLQALRIALEATEEAITHQSAQHSLRTKAALKRKGLHPDDLEMELYLLQTTTDELFPRVFRGGFLVSMWAVFESGIKDIAEYTWLQLEQPFGLQDLRASEFLEQAERFFGSTLQIAPFPDKSIRKKIEIFKGFRNALAHHDGNVKEMPKSLQPSAPGVFQTFSDLHRTFAMPTAIYNLETLDIVEQVSSELAEAVYERLHPSAPSGA